MAKELFIRALEAFAIGDAVGLPTEFMTRDEIRRVYNEIDGFPNPEFSRFHSDLPAGSISDDTEQNLFLLDAFREKGISTEATVYALLKWIEESRAVEKKFIGPSSLKSLRAIQSGESPQKAGYGNTTCGSVMRVLSACLCTPAKSWDQLATHIYWTTLPTHFSESALEAALGFGFALNAAAESTCLEDIISAFFAGAAKSKQFGAPEFSIPSTAARVRFFLGHQNRFYDRDQVADYLSDVQGTGLYANEVSPSAFILFLTSPNDCWDNIRLAATLGGDTDTIAALAGALTALYNKGHNIPGPVVDRVLSLNRLHLEKYGEIISALRASKATFRV
ncbi:MAG TPA: ADP-ribosylglycohydrolase family protein [Thermotogota bacterium]|nr:ADP-ribosylglycohydrolase family protein [Thermotogota bacterium]